MREVDLNCDLGESYGAWGLGADEELLQLVTSANVACGYHAGDAVTIARTVELALARGVSVGAHPSYPDLQGFGRRSMALAPSELEAMLLYQVSAVRGIVRACGGELRHVKLHGALYNDAARDLGPAAATIRAVRRLDDSLLLYALAGSTLARSASDEGLRVVAEGFVDRRYSPDGALQSRHVAGALITNPEEAARQALGMVLDGTVTAGSGERVRVEAGTLCVHGDNPAAVPVARRVRAALEARGVEMRSPGARR